MGCGGGSKLSASDALMSIAVVVIPATVHVASFLLNGSPASWVASLMMLMAEFMLILFLISPSEKLGIVGASGIFLHAVTYPLVYIVLPISLEFALLLALSYAVLIAIFAVALVHNG